MKDKEQYVKVKIKADIDTDNVKAYLEKIMQDNEYKEQAQKAFDSLTLTTSYEEAADDADLIIEAIAEDPEQKIAFYEELAKYLAWLVDKQTCSPEWLMWLKDEVKT